MRIGAVLAFGLSTVRFGDAPAYLKTAEVLVETHTYPANVDPPVFRAPGYPVFLVLSTFGHPRNIPLDKVWNALLGSATVPLFLLFARRLFGSEHAALFVGALAAVHPSFVLLSTDVQSEALFLFLYAAAGLLLLIARDDGRKGLALLGGAALGAAALTRPTALAFAALVPLLLLDRDREKRFRLALAFRFVLGVFAVVAPWTVHNAIAYHAFIPVNDQAGMVLYLGNSELNEAYYEVRSRAEYARWMERASAEVATGNVPRLAGPPDTNPAVRSRALARAALSWMRAHPSRALRLFAHKALDWCRPWPSPWGWPWTIVIAIGLYNTVLSLMAVRGLLVSPRKGVAAAALATMALSMALHVIFLAIWRYRITFWDPVIVLYAGFAVATLTPRPRRISAFLT